MHILAGIPLIAFAEETKDLLPIATGIVAALAGVVIFLYKQGKAADSLKEQWLIKELERSNERHEKCEEDHKETKAESVEFREKLAALEGRVEGYQEAKADIKGLSSAVLDLIAEGKSKNNSS